MQETNKRDTRRLSLDSWVHLGTWAGTLYRRPWRTGGSLFAIAHRRHSRCAATSKDCATQASVADTRCTRSGWQSDALLAAGSGSGGEKGMVGCYISNANNVCLYLVLLNFFSFRSWGLHCGLVRWRLFQLSHGTSLPLCVCRWWQW